MIDACPRCDYALTGLPAEHACPECGLRYDAGSMVWRRKRGAWVVPTVGFVAIVTLPMLFDGLDWIAGSASRGPPVLKLALAVVAIFSIWLIVRGERTSLRNSLVASMPDGLVIRILGDHGQIATWAELDNVYITSAGWRNEPVVMIAQRALTRKPPVHLLNFFRHQSTAEEFAAQVRQRIDAAGKSDAVRGADFEPVDTSLTR